MTETIKQLDMNDTVIKYGGAVKALADGRIGGYLVTFSDANTPDLEQDFFNAQTDFGFEDEIKTPVYLNHRIPMPTREKGKSVVVKEKIGEGTLKKDENGILIDAILYNRAEYEKALSALGWSSGTAGHLVDTEPVGKAHWLKTWPLGLDASLTPTPAEPRNTVIPLKQLSVQLPSDVPAADKPQADSDGGEEAAETKDAPIINSERQEEEATMTEEIKSVTLTPEELQALVAQGAAEAIKNLPAPDPPKAKATVEVIQAAEDKPFETAGKFYKAVAQASAGGAEDVRLKSLKVKDDDGYYVREYKAQPTGLGEDEATEGGYLVGSERQPGLVERMYADGEVMNRVSWNDIGPNANGITLNALDETSRADGSRWGGIQGYWLAEAASKTASQPTFRQMQLRLKKVAALCYATDELLQDATALESWINRTVPMELRFKVEDAIINGNGAGKPQGILFDSNIYVSVTAETGQAAATVLAENIDKMYSRMWAPSLARAVWYINQDVYPELFGLERAVGTGGSAAFMPPGGLSQAPYGTLLGKPIVPIEYAQTLGTLGDVIFADMSQYQAIRKGGIQSASSIHVQFLTDQTVFRFVYRVDGQSIWNSSLTPKNGTNTLSPFVVLATRS